MAKKQDKKFEKQEEKLQEVNEKLTGAGSWIEQHQKGLSRAFTIIVVLAFGFWAYNHFIAEPKRSAAQQALNESMSNLLYSNDLTGAAESFAETADSYSNKYGKTAALFAGICYYQLNDFETAVDYLARFDGDDMHFKALAKQQLGDAYVELEDYEAAVEAFEAAAKTDNAVIAPMSLKKAGIVYLNTLKDTEAAYEAFTTIKEKYPTSKEAQDIDKFIELAK